MRRILMVVLALLPGGFAAAQGEARPNPLEPRAKAPPVEYRSAFEGYRAFADQDLGDWRKSNDEVGAAGGHAGHKPGQGPGQKSSKPQPGKPETSGHGGHK
jgi:hypothetical protein